ncbi:MAG: MEDS domain-containing protein [Thermocaproicibacter melissae]|jgi:hypothetical protein|uniref:hypothetical protein n=1 Tax=Thermocaproicibacter melissae TaxID=2966552 RepID=UPI0024B0596D|nr:hypothetical protein [Thermocaproicibacter melissae]WBY64006.1 hypothetical protein NOG13_08640 [Thermocaproicibacter melissae]
MAQYIDKMLVPSVGIIRHIVGFGMGDPGYNVLDTQSKDYVPCVVYYFRRGMEKRSVSVTKYQGKYFLEYCTYSSLDAVLTTQKKSYTLRTVTRDFLFEAVKAYRAYRLLYNEYPGFREDIYDALRQGIGCVYLGSLGKDRTRLIDLMTRSGFHVTSYNFDTVTTKEGICVTLDGLCFRPDEVIP